MKDGNLYYFGGSQKNPSFRGRGFVAETSDNDSVGHDEIMSVSHDEIMTVSAMTEM